MTTLVVVAHPDDETLGCGGTIARLASEGETVTVFALANSRVPTQHLHRATGHLGAELIINRLPDQRFDTVPLLDITHRVEEIIAHIGNVSVIYTHHPGDLNQDHRITYQAVMTACRPVNGCPVRTVYAMEIPSSTEWGDHSFHPTTYIDIAATLERKIEAMEMYETERRGYPHPRSPQALRDLAHHRGTAAGLEAAEAFQLIRQISNQR